MTLPRRSKHSATSSSATGTTVVRRPHVEWTHQEKQLLVDAVATHGRKWTKVLGMYRFHPQRTADDLKEKYSRIPVCAVFLLSLFTQKQLYTLCPKKTSTF